MADTDPPLGGAVVLAVLRELSSDLRKGHALMREQLELVRDHRDELALNRQATIGLTSAIRDLTDTIAARERSAHNGNGHANHEGLTPP